jgi:hypothetical protein
MVIARCYDSRTSGARILCRRRFCVVIGADQPLVPQIRQSLLAVAWLVAVLLIALGAAGLVAGMDVPATAGSRPWLTAKDDVVVTSRLDAIAADLGIVADRLDALGVQGRGALSALVANDPETAAAALDEGDRLVADIGARATKIATALDDVPVVGTEEAGYRLGPAVRDRHARLAAALASTRGVEASWLQLATGSAAATRLSNLLADHDAAVIAAAEQGRDAEYEAALTILDDADTAIADARRLRNALARTVEVVTLDEWLDRSARYDVALRDLYAALSDSGGRVNNAVRKAMTEERKAKDRLPPDTRGLVLIMAEIGRGGMNGAVIAIEEARGRLSAAVVEPAPSPGT